MDGTRGGSFHGEMEKASAGLQHLVICPNMTGRIKEMISQNHVQYTCFLRKLLFHGSKLTEGDRCGRKDGSENIYIFFTRKLDVGAGYVFSPLFFTTLLSFSFLRDNQVCERTLSCWRLSLPGIYEDASASFFTIVYYFHTKLGIGRQRRWWREI